MDDTQETLSRKASLISDLTVEIGFEKTRATTNHAISFTLLFLAITASALAGILGLAEILSTKWIGVIALLPTIFILFERSFKFEERGAWHKRKQNRLSDLRDQLVYQQPTKPSVEQISAINKKKHNVNYIMQMEWEARLRLGWSHVEQQSHKLNHSEELPSLPK